MYTVSLYSPRKGTLTLESPYDTVDAARSAAENLIEAWGYDQATIWGDPYEDSCLLEIVEVIEK